MLQTICLAIVFYIFGDFLNKKFKCIGNLCIAAPIIGGLIFAIFNLIISRNTNYQISLNTSFNPLLSNIFFTAIGLKISTKLIKKGGNLLIRYWIVCSILSLIQNLLVIKVSGFLNIHPLLSLTCGSTTMQGGHSFALAFGNTIQSLGIKNAIDYGLTSATLGLIFGGLVGGPFGKFLIEKYNLKPNPKEFASRSKVSSETIMSTTITTYSFFKHLLVILICLELSQILCVYFLNSTGWVIPEVVTSIFLAVIIKSIDEKLNFLDLESSTLDLFGDISLGIFLAASLMNLDLYNLSSHIPTILFLVICQLILILLYAYFFCFRFLGKDFTAACMLSGMIGHGLGATPNALANMGELREKYGPAPKAFLVVPLVSSFLMDTTNVPCILFFINFYKN
jgi:ESS family glutamate:Na+ symporter